MFDTGLVTAFGGDPGRGVIDMSSFQGDGSGAYATSTCVRGARLYAVVVVVSDQHVVCWCVDRAEARDIADRLNARVSRATPRRLAIPQMRRRAS